MLRPPPGGFWGACRSLQPPQEGLGEGGQDAFSPPRRVLGGSGSLCGGGGGGQEVWAPPSPFFWPPPECPLPGTDLEINPTLESLCLSMTEHALGGEGGSWGHGGGTGGHWGVVGTRGGHVGMRGGHREGTRGV